MKTGKEIEAEYSQQFAGKINDLIPLDEMIDIAMCEAIVEQDKLTREACHYEVDKIGINDADIAIEVMEAIMNTKAVLLKIG